MQKTVKNTEWKYNIGYIVCWYLLSTILSIYNKTLMSKDDMHLPLFMSAIHAGIQAIITRILIKRYNYKLETYSLLEYITKVVPCGIAAAMEICCGNASLLFVTLSFYTMIKSSTPVWVLLFSFLFGFEKPKSRLIGMIGLIVLGVLMTMNGEANFNLNGFVLVLIASVASGLRWNLTQLLMKHHDHPLSTMYHLSPIMFISMLSLSLFIENPIKFDQHPMDTLYTISAMSVGGILAFIMILAELYLIKGTSTVTLSVAGISKEILVISLSVILYDDVLTFKTYVGLFVSILGIIGYNYYKYLEHEKTE